MKLLGVRKEILIAAAVALINIIVFGTVSPYFIFEIHHHWMVPFFCAVFFLQAIAAVKLPVDWGKPIYFVLFALTYFTGIIFAWRQFSMFQCFRHCEGRLAVGLGFLTLTFLAAWRSVAFRNSRIALWSAGVFAVWAIIVTVLGFAYGTINFS